MTRFKTPAAIVSVSRSGDDRQIQN